MIPVADVRIALIGFGEVGGILSRVLRGRDVAERETWSLPPTG